MDWTTFLSGACFGAFALGVVICCAIQFASAPMEDDK